MPRPSYDFIMNQLRECQKENGALATDEEWNILTRKALPFRLRRVAESARWVVLVRIHTTAQDMQNLNGSVRRALNVRDANCLERARWSGNEAVFILAAEPEGLCDKLTPVFRNEGLSASLAYVPFSGNISYDHNRAALSMAAHVYKEV